MHSGPHSWRNHLHTLCRWLVLTIPLGLATGSACALFLLSLDKVTLWRFAHPELLYLLPPAGIAIAWIYQRYGKNAGAGNHLLLASIHHQNEAEPSEPVPRRMAPLILISTLVTHLFGGSAGREGTALQMGGALASAWGRVWHLPSRETRILLVAGIAAGFGGIFGTPWAGTVFALEILAIRSLIPAAFIPCLLAAGISHWTCTAWKISHTVYEMTTPLPWFNFLLMVKIALASIAFGLASLLFIHGLRAVQRGLQVLIPNALLRPAAGGILLIALAGVLGTRDYLGLGVLAETSASITLTSAFQADGAQPFSWWWKILFTVITLGSGFKGGEVTPLFFIGATLGNTLGVILNAPVDLFAAMGFVALFAGATKAPLACILMSVELFGPEYALYAAVACGVAWRCSGRASIYPILKS